MTFGKKISNGNLDRSFSPFLWIKLLLCSHQSHAALVLTFENKIHCTSRFTGVACQSVSVLVFSWSVSCPHLPCFLISVFFSYFLSFSDLLHVIMSPRTERNGHECFLVWGGRKKAFSLFCHEIKCTVPLLQIYANMKWQKIGLNCWMIKQGLAAWQPAFGMRILIFW